METWFPEKKFNQFIKNFLIFFTHFHCSTCRETIPFLYDGKNHDGKCLKHLELAVTSIIASTFVIQHLEQNFGFEWDHHGAKSSPPPLCLLCKLLDVSPWHRPSLNFWLSRCLQWSRTFNYLFYSSKLYLCWPGHTWLVSKATDCTHL